MQLIRKRMNTDALLWMVLPLALMILIVVIRIMLPKGYRSGRKGFVVGLIITAIIIIVYAAWRLTQGGF